MVSPNKNQQSIGKKDCKSVFNPIRNKRFITKLLCLAVKINIWCWWRGSNPHEVALNGF